MGKMFIIILTFSTLLNVHVEKPQYKIERIKSLKNYYIIYASKNDSTYKIVSKKIDQEACMRIKKNRCYTLELEKVNSLAGPEVECFSFDEQTEICRESGMGLYIATNLNGLCIVD